MELSHSFSVPLDPDAAFDVLTDIDRIAPCMPGATIESIDGDQFAGRVKVKVGPMQITYRGRAEFVEKDRAGGHAVIEARAQETRGSGTANATITADLEHRDGVTEVTVVTALAVTGRPAQFGRGVMNDVGAKLLNQFTACLSNELSTDTGDAEQDDTSAGVADTQEIQPTAEQTDTAAAAASGPASNGSPVGVTEQKITGVAGAAPPQPASGAAAGAAAPAPLPDAPPATRQPDARPAPAQTPTRANDDAIDLLDVAGAPIAKRVAPVLAVLALVVLLWQWRRTR